MKTLITEALVARLRREPDDVEVRDTRCRGLVLRCRATGQHSYRFQVRRGESITIGRIDDFTPPEARTEADKLRGDKARGKDPAAERRAAHASSLTRFIEAEYKPWVLQHRKTGAETLERLGTAFPDLGPVPLAGITKRRVEHWRTARLAEAVRPATVNRDLAALRSVLTRAVDFGVLPTHPLKGLKALVVDQRAIVRYLSEDEEQRLRDALEARDDRRRAARGQANTWRLDRGYDLLPVFGVFTDHVSPLILTALHTGLRRGELLGLTWADVDLDRRSVTVRGSAAKSGETRHVPLNSDLTRLLADWRGPVERTGYVFADAAGDRIKDVKTAWASIAKAAQLTAFRFHDLRHSFASKLVMAGVDLNTTRELLGHASIAMTLRYAHLAPAVKAAAVEKLVRA